MQNHSRMLRALRLALTALTIAGAPLLLSAMVGLSGVARAAEPTEHAAALGQFEVTLARLSHEHVRYPSDEREQGHEGTTGLRVDYAADGRNTGIEIAESSGHRSLDLAARRGVQAAVSRSRVPAALRGTAFSARVQVRYIIK